MGQKLRELRREIDTKPMFCVASLRSLFALFFQAVGGVAVAGWGEGAAIRRCHWLSRVERSNYLGIASQIDPFGDAPVSDPPP